MEIISPLVCLSIWICIVPLAFGAFPDRYGVRSCTLTDDAGEKCQVKSALGSNTASDSFNGIYVFLGENNCTLTLKDCHKNTCYSFRDLTSQLPSDAGVAATTGIFSNITVLQGAENIKLTREGFAFKATQSTVVLLYSTLSCAAFYAQHGRVGQQLCNMPVEAITRIEAFSPNSLSCA